MLLHSPVASMYIVRTLPLTGVLGDPELDDVVLLAELEEADAAEAGNDEADADVPGVDFMNQFWQQFCNLRTKLKMAQELLSMAV
jgi:hypothetical protein